MVDQATAPLQPGKQSPPAGLPLPRSLPPHYAPFRSTQRWGEQVGQMSLAFAPAVAPAGKWQQQLHCRSGPCDPLDSPSGPLPDTDDSNFFCLVWKIVPSLNQVFCCCQDSVTSRPQKPSEVALNLSSFSQQPLDLHPDSNTRHWTSLCNLYSAWLP